MFMRAYDRALRVGADHGYARSGQGCAGLKPGNANALDVDVGDGGTVDFHANRIRVQMRRKAAKCLPNDS